MKKNKIIVFWGICLLTITSCTVEPTFYRDVSPEIFYTSQDAVWQRFNRSFTHWRWWVGHMDEGRWALQELGTDEYALPTRGSDWFDQAQYQQVHHHEYKESMSWVNGAWTNYGMGVALAWDALEDLEKYVDFDALGFAQGAKESMLFQQQTLVASFYLDGLDLFGGCPLYSEVGGEVKGRSTDVETFNFIEKLLKEAMPNLPIRKAGDFHTGSISRAACAALLIRLYFNAEAYIRKPMYAEAAAICQDIINGVYGTYTLAKTYQEIFGFTNERCDEMIWSVPSQNAQTQSGGTYWTWTAHYNFRQYLGNLTSSGGNNGIGLVPGLDPYGVKYSGPPYNYKIGGVYSRMHDSDLRKKKYVYTSNGNYEGMFWVGQMIHPSNPDWKILGGREYAGTGQPIEFVDQVAQFYRIGKTVNGVFYPDLASVLAAFPSDIRYAEESNLVRSTKRSPRPTSTDQTRLGNPDIPFIRLAEIYYTLAECKMRTGDLNGAAELINTVRKRYFTGGNDPDPVSASNLDKYRMLNEWSLEFFEEGRRRTDLIRWDAYVTEPWWDHVPSNSRHLHRFPLHTQTMGANTKLEQNPGYK